MLHHLETHVAAFAWLVARLEFPFADRPALLAQAGIDEAELGRLQGVWQATLEADHRAGGELGRAFGEAFLRGRADEDAPVVAQPSPEPSRSADPPSSPPAREAHVVPAVVPTRDDYDAAEQTLADAPPDHRWPVASALEVALPFRGERAAPAPAAGEVAAEALAMIGATAPDMPVLEVSDEEVEAQANAAAPAASQPPASPLPPHLAALTLEQVAGLLVEMEVQPSHGAELLPRYAIANQLELQRLTRHWTDRRRADPSVQARWHAAEQAYRAWRLRR